MFIGGEQHQFDPSLNQKHYHRIIYLIIMSVIKIFSIFLLTLFPITSKKQSYMIIQTTRVQNDTHQSLNLELDINQHPYSLALSLQSHPNHIISFQQPPKSTQTSSLPDYRKHQRSVYGVVSYQAYWQVDSRHPSYLQIPWNLYHYILNFPFRQQWVDFKQFKQIKKSSAISELSEGNIDLSNFQKSPFFNSLKKYNQYYKNEIVTFQTGAAKNGWLYLGDYPRNLLKNAKEYSSVKMLKDHQENNILLKVGVDSVNLEKAGQIKSKAPLHPIHNNYILTLSKKTLELPQNAIKSLQEMLQGCQIQHIKNEKLFTCRQDRFEQYKDFKIVFDMSASKHNIEYKLAHLLRKKENKTAFFNIAEAQGDNIHLSVLMMKDYLVGFDFNQGELLFGPKKAQFWLTREHIFKLLLLANIFIFIVSFFILTIASQLKPYNPSPKQSSLERNPKSHFFNSKTSGYEMAQMSQQTQKQLEQQ